jgi:hypothetical protein
VHQVAAVAQDQQAAQALAAQRLVEQELLDLAHIQLGDLSLALARTSAELIITQAAVLVMEKVAQLQQAQAVKIKA